LHGDTVGARPTSRSTASRHAVPGSSPNEPRVACRPCAEPRLRSVHRQQPRRTQDCLSSTLPKSADLCLAKCGELRDLRVSAAVRANGTPPKVVNETRFETTGGNPAGAREANQIHRQDPSRPPRQISPCSSQAGGHARSLWPPRSPSLDAHGSRDCTTVIQVCILDRATLPDAALVSPYVPSQGWDGNIPSADHDAPSTQANRQRNPLRLTATATDRAVQARERPCPRM
jgi:hypothetical protein